MNAQLKDQLIVVAKEYIKSDDPSHDILHTMRVLTMAIRIAEDEKADLDIVIPSALFHDVIVYPKNDPRSKLESTESATLAETVLTGIQAYPKNKITAVKQAITECSYTKGIIPETLESKILQDADRLEATGAISIMRTFASVGQMKSQFFHPDDPFCKNREPQPLEYGIDLFYARLLRVEQGMHTKLARSIAHKRTIFLQQFLSQLEEELDGVE